MATHFETLVYTDCRPGQGLRGSAGLQFQARSSDAVAGAENVVKDHLLYEPPSRWMADRRAVEDYPPSYAHMSAAGYLATARGLYLGREVNGTREGNQLTHAIVTTDADAYGGMRPAQLYGAGFWSPRPSDTTHSEPVTVSATGGPYTPGRARDFVLSRRDGATTLARLVTVLATAGEPGKPRVLFVGDDTATIVEWLVAGTLLVSRERAFELGFKVFANDPARTRAPIVAVHPDFAGESSRIDNRLGYAVFDLRTDESTAIQPSDDAKLWVGLFLDGDPRDAVDALDVAAESTLTPPKAAIALGLASIMHERPDPDYAVPIVDWLRTGPDRLRAAYGSDLADLFAEEPERWSREVLELLDAVGSDGMLPGKAADVRIALLIKEIDAAVTLHSVRATRLAPLPPQEWEPDRDRQVRDLIQEAVTHPARPGIEIDSLLRLAKRSGAVIHPGGLGENTTTLARYVAEDPDRYSPDLWPNGAEMEQPLIDALGARVRRGGAEPAKVGDQWRQWLAGRRPEALPDGLLASMLGAVVRLDANRDEVVERELTGVRDHPQNFSWMAGNLFSQSLPSRAEMRRLAELAPRGVKPQPRLFTKLVDDALRGNPLDHETILLCRTLIRAGLLIATGGLTAVLQDEQDLADVLGQLGSTPRLTTAQANHRLRQLLRIDARLIQLRSGKVVTALAESASCAVITEVLDAFPELTQPYLVALRRALRSSDEAESAAVAFFLSRSRFARDKQRRGPLLDSVDNWFVRAPEKQVSTAAKAIVKLGPDWQQSWEDYQDKLGGKRKRHRLTHPFGGRS